MKILITGCAGFIGYHLTRFLLKKKFLVYGLDNLNNYYDVKLKRDRLKDLNKNKKFKFSKIDLVEYSKLNLLFKKNNFDCVINLAAQAGVRNSIQDPDKYFKYNVEGFYKLLKLCKVFKIKHFIFASTSSIYGDNKILPLNEKSKINPIQFYSATKNSNEVFGNVFSKIYKMKITGLRFFTVYGPFGRPDMAIFKFTKKIFEKSPITIFNNGNHSRDFTYIDDIVKGIYGSMVSKNKRELFEIFNLGSGKKIHLSKLLKIIEKKTKLKFKVKKIGLQIGDVKSTHSDIKKAKKILGYSPRTKIEKGIENFISWYVGYYKKK